MHFNQYEPNESELKFKGTLARVYQRDVKGKIFEYVVMPSSAKILAITREGKLVLLKETVFSTNKTYFSLPGGRIEPDETPEAAARRELKEETGLEPASLELWFAHNYSQTIVSTKYFYLAKGCIKVQGQNPEDTERIEVMELDLDTFLQYATRDNFKHMELQNKFMKMMLDNDAREEFASVAGLQAQMDEYE